MCWLQHAPSSFLQVEYRLGYQVENPNAMNTPQSNISSQGEVPRVPSGLSVDPCYLILKLVHVRFNPIKQHTRYCCKRYQ